jgi:hypothetical protein
MFIKTPQQTRRKKRGNEKKKERLGQRVNERTQGRRMCSKVRDMIERRERKVKDNNGLDNTNREKTWKKSGSNIYEERECENEYILSIDERASPV